MLGKLAERLLPLVLAVVAGLVLAVGIRGFRAEQPSGFRLNPFSTTPLVTEAAAPATEEIALADGSTLVLRPGNIAFALARFLNGAEPAPQSFALAGIQLPLAGDDAGSRQTLRSLAAVLRAWPEAGIAFEGNPAEAEPLLEALRAEGVAPGQLAMENTADAPPRTVQPPIGELAGPPLRLVLTRR